MVTHYSFKSIAGAKIRYRINLMKFAITQMRLLPTGRADRSEVFRKHCGMRASEQ